MQRLQAFKYELMPTGEQQRDLRRFAGSCRFVFNQALALQKERDEQGEKRLSYFRLAKLLTEWRNGKRPGHLLAQGRAGTPLAAVSHGFEADQA